MATLKENLKFAGNQIKELTVFEFPYKLKVSALYEREEPTGFSDELKLFVKEQFCTGFEEKESV